MISRTSGVAGGGGGLRLGIAVRRLHLGEQLVESATTYSCRRDVTSDQRCRLDVGARASPRAGEQLVEPALRMILHTRDDVGEVGKRVETARFARRYERVEPGDARTGF